MTIRLDGILVVDKPEGVFSSQVVREVKRRLRVKKAGHIGTLDPFATGALPVAVNEGTKLVPFVKDEPKEYQAVLKLGEETTTEDVTGEVTARGSWEGLTPEGVCRAVEGFSGKILQRPPMFSAVKVQGTPLYRLARKGMEVERREREVEVFRIKVEEVDLPRVRFSLSCSKGTYVRRLSTDIGRRIGCGAHLLSLRRVRSGLFTLERSISWEALRSLDAPQTIDPWFIPMEEALPAWPEFVGDQQLTKRVRFGQEVEFWELPALAQSALEQGQWLKLFFPGEGLVAILKSAARRGPLQGGRPEALVLRPVRVFQPNHRTEKAEYQ